mmetsp:Transcript_25395/g.55213  ORF Transcript_25395/g.55213 Transcript_25395/m.55213 type:complete len:220 (-) Transcript_25395:128-787(-)|eukprot:CAMPEP_0118944304 /NCGR_PEP_ID=MMETSP1169-20130426/40057_1 /TAXON_ID=36882 /ORGANISM="Pyramimonas obovata, Strain CCMP722" /LENGTH=219 /DNA_ID=CAMNT_0006889761 /DNA_START=34 /DNA_END=693 /DNA_ORIENTATION=+
MSLVGGDYGSDSEAEEEENPFDVPTVPKSCPRPVVSSSDSDRDSDDDVDPPCEEHTNTPISAPAQSSGLPDPLAALSEAAPEFLNPEATRQIAVLYRPPPPPKAWEEIPMTPAEAKAALEANRRKAAASGGVTTAKAVIYKDEQKDEGFDTSKVDPLALAMLGVEAQSSKLKRSVVLGSGEKGEVKEREKKKRMMGQNGRDSVTWKSEEEMILRQQFDS